MKQQEYLQELELGLRGRMPESEIQDILEEYRGFFVDGLAEGRTEESISEGLGLPAQLVSMLTEQENKATDNKSKVSGFVDKPITQPLASLGQRIGAALIDHLVVLVILIVIYSIAFIINAAFFDKFIGSNEMVIPVTRYCVNSIILMIPLFYFLSFAVPVKSIVIAMMVLVPYSNADDSLSKLSIIIILAIAFSMFYKPIIECIWSGRTIGKRLLGIRVSNENGNRVSIGSILIRELLGEGMLATLTAGITTIVSIFTVAIGRPRKSVPDYIASTLVVADRTKKQRKLKGEGAK